MDIADVAYDYFLANGQPETSINTSGGDTVRLRIINGSATTYFHLEYSGGPMTIISADGLDVQPVEQQRFLIGVAETYDVLIKTPPSGAYELRATAHDASGYASIWLGNGQRNAAPNVPKPNLYESMNHGGHASIWALTPGGVMGMSDKRVESGDFDRPGMMGMQDMSMDQGQEMGHGDHAASDSKDMHADQEPVHESHEMPGTAMTKAHEMDSMKKSDPTAHAMPKAQHDDRKGKNMQEIFVL
jgi:FtsP/CotA-like multicopper oxidase with cupredoxin domain